MLAATDELFDCPFHHSDDDLPSLAKSEKRLHDFEEVQSRWRRLAKKALNVVDPWEAFHLASYDVKECVRYRYSSVRQKWITDTVYVKMETEPFGHGAMRECFRLIKSDSNEPDKDWRGERNHVAKRYMVDVPRDTYFEDVRLQMDAKLWAEEFNRHNPPKKIDIVQVCVIEFVDCKALYHLEKYIDGNYVKYNSNSGYVNSIYRQTPQAFSHFTFERSAHQLIVVDIQGVGDLYTDPQIHTFDGKGYGDGNLGTRGMALFFYSHACNSICESMHLTKFDLAPGERAARKRSFMSKLNQSETLYRLSEVEKCVSPSRTLAAMEFVRARSLSSVNNNNNGSDLELSPGLCNGFDGDVFDNSVHIECHSASTGSVNDSGVSISPVRCRFDSDVDGSVSGAFKEAFWEVKRRQSRPACLMVPETAMRSQREAEHEDDAVDNTILGMIHIDLARYHELGRFCNADKGYDRASAWFHLHAAADCGVREAVMTMAKIYLGLPHDLLHDFTAERDLDNDDNDDDFQGSIDTGLDWMERGAKEMRDRSAILYMAEAYRTGDRLGSERQRSYAEALKYYTMLLRESDGRQAEASADDRDTPRHEILAAIAELYRTGGPQLKSDAVAAAEYYSMAAEAATEAMMGKLATRYFALAEEATCESGEGVGGAAAATATAECCC